MGKREILWIVIYATLLLSCTGREEQGDGKEGELVPFVYAIEEDGVIIYEYIGEGEVSIVPDEIEGKKVKGYLKRTWFSLEAVGEMEHIRESFLEGSKMNMIDFSKCSTITIGNYAFYNCHDLEKMRLPESVEEIGDGVFKNCDHLEELKLPEHIKRIGEEAFYQCIQLKKIQIPEEVEVLEKSVFEDCISLFSVTLSKRLKEIEKRAFLGCSSLKSLELPDNIQWIEEDAFEECKDLTLYCKKGSLTHTTIENALLSDGVTVVVVP